MRTVYANTIVGALADRWWAVALRGVAAVLFGVLTFIAPGMSLAALVFLWGAYALADGALNIVLTAQGARYGRSRGWLLFQGLIGIAAGVFAFARPAMTALVLLTLIALWAVVTGIAEVAAAIHLRRTIRHEWMLVSSGVLSILFGAVLLWRPGAGALALLWMIGGYAVVFGALLIGLGLRLNSWRRRGERPFPTRGTPTPA